MEAGQVVARVTPWRDGAPHAHIEVWKNRDANYRFERMEDPMKYFKVFKIGAGASAGMFGASALADFSAMLR